MGINFKERINKLESGQPALRHLGISVSRVDEGEVDLVMKPDEKVTQQNGFVHAGVLATMADTAGGFAAYTMFGEGEDVLSIEFKINLLKPAVGDLIIACGKVLKSGKNVFVSESEVFAETAGQRKMVAKATITLFRVKN